MEPVGRWGHDLTWWRWEDILIVFYQDDLAPPLLHSSAPPPQLSPVVRIVGLQQRSSGPGSRFSGCLHSLSNMLWSVVPHRRLVGTVVSRLRVSDVSTSMLLLSLFPSTFPTISTFTGPANQPTNASFPWLVLLGVHMMLSLVGKDACLMWSRRRWTSLLGWVKCWALCHLLWLLFIAHTSFIIYLTFSYWKQGTFSILKLGNF